MKCVAIGGVPATGKTTLMRNIIKKLQPKQDFSYGLLRGMYKNDIAILGIYKDKEVFAGTDKLSMAVQNHFSKYVAKKHKHIMFEGDRLFTKNNLLSLIKTHDTKIIILNTSEKNLAIRHKERNDRQNVKFLKSRETKLKNISEESGLEKSIEYHDLKTIKQSEELAQKLIQFIDS
jgi:adenylate kinase